MHCNRNGCTCQPATKPTTKLSLMRLVRNRAEQIRLAAMSFRKTAAKVAPRLIPFSELPEPCYMFTDDADLENFLRRNNLTDALQTYLRSQAERNLTAN
jgi:hypothetical protein